MKEPLINRLQKVPVNSGFRQEGYFVWCESSDHLDQLAPPV
jgi:hypothetical protein